MLAERNLRCNGSGVNTTGPATVIPYERTMIGARESTRAELSESDDGLVIAARGGDVEAFGLLYERHKDAVFSFVLNSIGRREDAEDIVQEVFCRAWRSIAGFRGEAKLTTWLMSIAVNACAEHVRRDRRKQRLGIEVELLPEDVRTDGDLASDSIRRDAAREALGSLLGYAPHARDPVRYSGVYLRGGGAGGGVLPDQRTGAIVQGAKALAADSRAALE